MWTVLWSKIFAILMPVVLLFNTAGTKLPGISEKLVKAEIGYEFDNDKFYSAAGTVSVSAKTDGKYDLYWGDENGEPLTEDIGGYPVTFSEFATVSVRDGKGKEEIVDFTLIPDGAETVLAYKNGVYAGKAGLPEEKTAAAEEPSYRFGAISDVHFNRYFLHLDDDAKLTLPNALNFFEKAGVRAVALPGDLTSEGEEKSLKLFNKYISEYDFPVYTCMGNHDTRGDAVESGAWEKYINPGVYGEEKAEGILDVNGRDFIYTPDDNDIFIFLSQYQWSYNSPDSELLSSEQLDWLEAKLAAYADRTVYLFFHTFLANQQTGDRKTGEGNAVNDKDTYYNLVYTPETADELRFTALLETYKNVIFFNGHSHFAFELQKLNPILNITDYDGKTCTMVHIPSVSSPRTMNQNSKDYSDNYLRKSQGYLVKVYPDRIVLQGVEFLKGQFISYACYAVERAGTR